jgi:phage terminase large subunit-like protein
MTYDPTKPAKVRKFLETYCIQSKGEWAGKPLVLMPYQWDDIIKPLFGTLREDGTRQYRRAGIWLSKKQGKSTLLSGVALYLLLEEPGAFVVVVATTKEQASIIYTEAAEMALAHPALRKRLWTRKNIKTIEDRKRKSVLKVLSIDQPRRLCGFNASAVLIDEIGSWGTHGRESYGHLNKAGLARKQPLEITISHAYYDRETIGHELYQYASEMKQGRVDDPSFLPVIYEGLGDWTSEETWKKANPALGFTITLDDMRAEFKRAKQSPREEIEFKTLRLNRWEYGGLDQWLLPDEWAACREDFDEDMFEGQEVWGGLDLSRKHDLTAFVWLMKKDDLIYILPRFYVAEDQAKKKERRNEGQYSKWARDGHITLCAGEIIDPRDIRADVVEDAGKMKVQELRYDSNNGQAENLCHVQLGLEDGLYVTEVPFVYSHLDFATSELERLIKERKIRHNGNPIMDWMIGNCRIKINDKGQILPDKMKSQSRIDGCAATVLALSAVLSEKVSIYSTRGLIAF